MLLMLGLAIAVALAMLTYYFLSGYMMGWNDPENRLGIDINDAVPAIFFGTNLIGMMCIGFASDNNLALDKVWGCNWLYWFPAMWLSGAVVCVAGMLMGRKQRISKTLVLT